MEHKNISRALALSLATALLFSAHAFAGTESSAATSGTGAPVIQQSQAPNSHDLFNVETMYTGSSETSGILARGRQDSTYNDISYGHRFPVTGNWDLLLGLEYERYDFTGQLAPLPDHLQDVHVNLAYEYVVHDFPAVALQLHPGFYFENNATWRTFNVPAEAFSSVKLYKDKVFGIGGVEYNGFIWPPISGFGGVIWLINDKTRLQAIMPRPALIYDPNDDWEYQLKGQINGQGFRLDQSGRDSLTYGNALLRYTYDQVGVQATCNKLKPFNISLGAGCNIQREFFFIHYGPDQKYRSSAAPYVDLTFSANF